MGTYLRRTCGIIPWKFVGNLPQYPSWVMSVNYVRIDRKFSGNFLVISKEFLSQILDIKCIRNTQELSMILPGHEFM